MAVMLKEGHGKMSAEFEARLRQVTPEERLRALVLLRRGGSKTDGGSRRQTIVDRNQKIKEFQSSSKDIIAEIDTILKRFGGRRLSDGVDALGFLPIETTSDGYQALLASPHTKAILENQRVYLLQK